IPPPACLGCGALTWLQIVRASNPKGNAGRPYYKCPQCGKFSCFADHRGCHPNNPLCACYVPSRMQVAGPDRTPPRGLHYVCRWGNCDFYSPRYNEN
ncbi:hypothetical protein LX36DRAFT_541431, partial [Colletotrichum falcatum]